MRNVHQAFGYGLIAGLMFAGAVAADRVAGGSRTCAATRATQRMRTLEWYYGLDVPVDRARATRRTSIDG